MGYTKLEIVILAIGTLLLLIPLSLVARSCWVHRNQTCVRYEESFIIINTTGVGIPMKTQDCVEWK
jgi:hypothetical protein